MGSGAARGWRAQQATAPAFGLSASLMSNHSCGSLLVDQKTALSSSGQLSGPSGHALKHVWDAPPPSPEKVPIQTRLHPSEFMRLEKRGALRSIQNELMRPTQRPCSALSSHGNTGTAEWGGRLQGNGWDQGSETQARRTPKRPVWRDWHLFGPKNQTTSIPTWALARADDTSHELESLELAQRRKNSQGRIFLP
jgi:hypothetical protein